MKYVPFLVSVCNLEIKCTFRFKIDIKFQKCSKLVVQKKNGKFINRKNRILHFYYDLSNVIDNFKYRSDMV